MRKLVLFAITISLIPLNGFGAERLHIIKILRGINQITEVRAEVANTPMERSRGLMFREELSEGRGMWFIFDTDVSGPFTMQNTYIALDMIFVDNNLEIVSISKNAAPLSKKLIYSKKPYRYVLEVPAGFTKKYDIKLKDKVRMLTTN